MKRFRFRLERIERWRRRQERIRRGEHAAALEVLLRAERTLDAQAEAIRDGLEAEARLRASEDARAESLAAAERLRASFERRREDLAREAHAASRETAATLGRLVEARRDLEVLESLRRARFSRWRREIDAQLQKHADEMHRSRRGRAEHGDE